MEVASATISADRGGLGASRSAPGVTSAAIAATAVDLSPSHTSISKKGPRRPLAAFWDKAAATAQDGATLSRTRWLPPTRSPGEAALSLDSTRPRWDSSSPPAPSRQTKQQVCVCHRSMPSVAARRHAQMPGCASAYPRSSRGTLQRRRDAPPADCVGPGSTHRSRRASGRTDSPCSRSARRKASSSGPGRTSHHNITRQGTAHAARGPWAVGGPGSIYLLSPATLGFR